eukprot:760155-Alexandrium_andersonii.AAC.1
MRRNSPCRCSSVSGREAGNCSSKWGVGGRDMRTHKNKANQNGATTAVTPVTSSSWAGHCGG